MPWASQLSGCLLLRQTAAQTRQTTLLSSRRSWVQSWIQACIPRKWLFVAYSSKLVQWLRQRCKEQPIDVLRKCLANCRLRDVSCAVLAWRSRSLVLISQATTILQRGWLISHTPRSSPRRCSICVGMIARHVELNKITTDKSSATDASGRFKRLPVSILDHLSNTLVRRAFALDMAGCDVCNVRRVEKDVAYSHARGCDKELWLHTENFCRHGVSL